MTRITSRQARRRGGRVSVLLVALAGVVGLAQTDGDASQRAPVEIARLVGAAGELELAGPVLGGTTVLWAQRDRRGAVTVRRARALRVPVRTAFRASLPRPPAGTENDPIYETAVEQRITAIEASSARAAFIRMAVLRKDPRCRRRVPPCLAPSLIEPWFSELWVSAGTRPFRRVVRVETGMSGPSCRWPRLVDVDVSAATVAYSQQTDACGPGARLLYAQVVIVSRRFRRTVVRASTRSRISEIALADRYIAWAQDASVTDSEQEIIVYNRRVRTTAYRIASRSIGLLGAGAVALQADGKIAIVGERPARSCPIPYAVAWASRARPRPHFLSVGAASPQVRMARDHITLAETQAPCGRAGRLVALDLAGRVSTLARLGGSPSRPTFIGGDFDFDGHRFCFALTRPAGGGSSRPDSYETSIYVGRLP